MDNEGRYRYVIRPDAADDNYGIFDTDTQSFVDGCLPVHDWALQGLVMRLNEQQQTIDRLQAEREQPPAASA